MALCQGKQSRAPVQLHSRVDAYEVQAGFQHRGRRPLRETVLGLGSRAPLSRDELVPSHGANVPWNQGQLPVILHAQGLVRDGQADGTHGKVLNVGMQQWPSSW